MHDAFPTPVPGLLQVHAAEIMPALIEVIGVAIGFGGPDDLGHGIGEETILISALAETVVGAGQFFGALEDAQLRIIVGAAKIVDGVAALLIDFGEREGVAPDHGEKEDGVADDKERHAAFSAECAVALAEKSQIAEDEGDAERGGKELAA